MMTKETWERLFMQRPVLPPRVYDEREWKREEQRRRFDRNRHKLVDMVTGMPRGRRASD